MMENASAQALMRGAQPWQVRHHHDFVHLSIEEMTLHSGMAKRLGEILTEQKNQGFRRILLEERVERWHLTTAQALALFDTLRLYDLFDLRLTFLTHHPERLGDLRFIETVAVNRGYEAKVFIDVTSALEWLLAG